MAVLDYLNPRPLSWEESNDDSNAMFLAKFDEHGNVIPGWSMQAWLEERWRDVPKTPTKNAVTVTHPRRKS
jgi:hypothetical protein